MKTELKRLLEAALQEYAEKSSTANLSTRDFTVDESKSPEHGDYASNIAMVMAKQFATSPRDLAEKLIENIPANTTVERCDIAGPGFLNFFLSQQSQVGVIQKILDAQANFGCAESRNEKVQVEFVSANPTGPLHVGHGRGAAVGDCLCRILETAGYQVTREFYYNDAGAQIDNLTRSVQLRCKKIGPEHPDWPEDGYRGDYIAELADSYLRRDTVEPTADCESIKALGDPDDADAIRRYAVAYLRREQDMDLRAFDVRFDTFSLESTLYADGSVNSVVKTLEENGHTFEKDGALWLRATTFGDDKDRVMRKSSGGYTYFVPDVAYHLNKWRRGYKTVINEQGSDHHGTIARVRAGLQALNAGIPKSWPDYILHQMVMVVKGGKEVKISKRAGSYVTLRDLIDQVGKDATRYFLCARKADAQLTFDIDLALEKSNENPVYYIQYAHARICSALDNATQQQLGFCQQSGVDNLDQLTSKPELALIKALAQYPETLAHAATGRAPHLIANYLKELAALLHGWYAAGNQDKEKQLLVSDKKLRNARLALASATRIVLANGMRLIGVTAPQRM